MTITPQTRMLLDRWPQFWVEWDEALNILQRQLPWNRRSIANRAGWLYKHSLIERDWLMSSKKDADGNSPCYLMTRRGLF